MVHEGREQRILSIDCKIHRFILAPFTGSILELPREDKEKMERVMTTGASKKGINFILEALGNLNEKEAAQREAEKKERKKQAETMLKSRAEEENKKKTHKQKSAEEDAGGTSEASKKSKKTPSEVVPMTTPLNPTPLQQCNPHETAGAKKPPASKRTGSPERKTKGKKMKATELADDTPLVFQQQRRAELSSMTRSQAWRKLHRTARNLCNCFDTFILSVSRKFSKSTSRR